MSFPKYKEMAQWSFCHFSSSRETLLSHISKKNKCCLGALQIFSYKAFTGPETSGNFGWGKSSVNTHAENVIF